MVAERTVVELSAVKHATSSEERYRRACLGCSGAAQHPDKVIKLALVTKTWIAHVFERVCGVCLATNNGHYSLRLNSIFLSLKLRLKT